MTVFRRVLRPLLYACALLAATACAAQDGPSFAIRGYQVEGNTLLPQSQISLVMMPFTGPRSSFETVQQGLEALEKAYLQAGYGSVRIELPEQEISDGVVRLTVVEARLDLVDVQGARHHDEANIRHALPALRSGEVVNMDALQRNLDLANEGFAKHTSVTFRQGAGDAQTDAVVRVVDEDPLRFITSLDNTGSETTGRYRLGFLMLHANLFNLDHALTVQLLTSPTRFDKVGILGLGYRVPLYGLGDSLDFTAGYSNVDSGRIDLFSVSGKGRILGARYNQNLRPAGEWRHKLAYGLDYRAYGNSVVPVGGGASQIPDLTVQPLSLGYSASLQKPERDATLSLTLTHNLAGGAKGSTAAFNQPGGRAGADAAFTTLRYAASLTERLSADWSLRGTLSGQATRDLLISAEQFGVGGADSVRGFSEREVAGDRGVRASAEVWGPDLAARQGWTGWRLQPIAFADAGWVRYNVAPGAVRAQSIASVGLGLRGSFERRGSFKFDYAYVADGVDSPAGTAGATRKGAWRLHGAVLWFF